MVTLIPIVILQELKSGIFPAFFGPAKAVPLLRARLLKHALLSQLSSNRTHETHETGAKQNEASGFGNRGTAATTLIPWTH
jgi:hypothetical protein